MHRPNFIASKLILLSLALAAWIAPNRATAQVNGQAVIRAATVAEEAMNKGNFKEAVRQYEIALSMAPQTHGETHEVTTLILNNLGNNYESLGQYAKAETAYRRALKARTAAHGAKNEKVGDVLLNLGNLYQRMGQYPQAEPLYVQSLEIFNVSPGASSAKVGIVQNSLGSLYQKLGQLDKAQAIYERTIKQQEARLGSHHKDLAAPIQNLASIYHKADRFDKAEVLYRRALQIQERNLGADHSSVGETLVNLAAMYVAQNQFAKAEPIYLRALKIQSAKLTTNHPSTATTLGNLATLYRTLGDYSKAEPLQRRSLKMRELTLGLNHPDIARYGWLNLAQLHAAMNKPAEALVEIERSRQIVRRHTATVLPVLTESEQLAFLDETDRFSLETAVSFAVKFAGQANVAERSAAWLLNGKAVAQETLAEKALLGRGTSDEKLKTAVKQLNDVRQQLAALTLAEAKAGEEAKRQKQLDDLTKRQDELSVQVGRLSGNKGPSTWHETAALRRAIPQDAVLIDLVRYAPTIFEARGRDAEQGPARYAAWIVPAAGRGEVRVVDLGEASTIEATLKPFQTAMAAAQSPDMRANPLAVAGETEATATVDESLDAVSMRVLGPLLPHLLEARELIISPDADLWLLPWAALRLNNDQEQPLYAIEKWDLRYVVSGRDLLTPAKAGQRGKAGQPQIFADPDYDLLPVTLASSKSTLRAAPAPKAGERSRTNTALPRVARLPGTAAEAAAIRPKLQAYTGQAPVVHLAQNAIERAIKSLNSPQALVLSTHGFFLPEVKSKAGAANRTAAQNPLLRCGLLFAGCNRGATSANLADDGILTGMEIVGCDLRDTELVVLSACETGLGDVHDGEGVAGLRQAFQLAGAKSVVSTLWQIPDVQSAQLMAAFFSNLAEGQSKAQALRNAQLAMIKARQTRNGAAHPLFWAAFTVTGQ